jgi:AhpD family alkylhydroperoxidase
MSPPVQDQRSEELTNRRAGDCPRLGHKTIAHHALYIRFGQAGEQIHQQPLWMPGCKNGNSGPGGRAVTSCPTLSSVLIICAAMSERREPTYTYSEEQVAARSALARQFIETRRVLNAKVEKADNYLVKRFYNLDHNTYLEGAIPAKYKELMGLVVSAGLRCDDCINYHIIQSYRLNATRAEQEEALNVALVVGGSIVVPHLRRAYAMLEELYGE